MAVAAQQAFADEWVTVRVDAADVQVRLGVAEAVDLLNAAVGESGGRTSDSAVGTLEGKHDPAGKDVLRKRLLQELIAANAVAAGGQEANVVVLRARVPARGDQGEGKGEAQPDPTNLPWMRGGQPTEVSEHAQPLGHQQRAMRRRPWQ
jgi:hypothetical protein